MEPNSAPQETNSTSDTPLTSPEPNTPVSPDPVQRSKMPWIVGGLVALLVVVGGVFGYMHFNKKTPTSVVTTPKVHIGISMDTLQGLRWPKDEQFLQDDAKAQNAATTVLVADGDDATQVSQINNLISQKVDVLIVIPHNSDAVAPEIAKAHAAGIKVVSYDRLTLNGDADFYVSFNNAQVGTNEAKYVVDALPTGKVANVAFVGGSPTDNNATQIHTAAMAVVDPLVTAGKIKLTYDQSTVDWQPDTAYASFKAFLDKGNTVDGVICANDGMATGIIKALQEKGLAGKVAVSGQDADLAAVQRIVAGTQTMTNYKSVKDLAARAITIAVDLARNKKPVSNAKTNDGTKNVPSYLLQPTAVTKNNIMQTVVKDGFLSKTDIYQK